MSEVKLTKTELILAFIIRYKREHYGCSPSIQDIMSELHISSTSVVNYHLAKLYEAGELIPGPRNEARMIGVPGLTVEWEGGDQHEIAVATIE